MNRLQPLRRPPGACQGYQSWQDLLFLHWEVPVELLRPPVHHRSYALHRAKVAHSEDKLLSVCGVAQLGTSTEAFFSPGVDVEIFPQRRVA